MTFKASTSMLVLVARESAFAIAAIIANSVAARETCSPYVAITGPAGCEPDYKCQSSSPERRVRLPRPKAEVRQDWPNSESSGWQPNG